MIPSHPFPYEITCFRDTDSWGFILNQCLAMFFLSLPYGFFTPERWTLRSYIFKGSKPGIGTQWRTLHKQETWDLEEMMKNASIHLNFYQFLVQSRMVCTCSYHIQLNYYTVHQSVDSNNMDSVSKFPESPSKNCLCIVDLPTKKRWFSVVMLVYHRFPYFVLDGNHGWTLTKHWVSREAVPRLVQTTASGWSG